MSIVYLWEWSRDLFSYLVLDSFAPITEWLGWDLGTPCLSSPKHFHSTLHRSNQLCVDHPSPDACIAPRRNDVDCYRWSLEPWIFFSIEYTCDCPGSQILLCFPAFVYGILDPLHCVLQYSWRSLNRKRQIKIYPQDDLPQHRHLDFGVLSRRESGEYHSASVIDPRTSVYLFR
jgi:hypothetical protein